MRDGTRALSGRAMRISFRGRLGRLRSLFRTARTVGGVPQRGGDQSFTSLGATGFRCEAPSLRFGVNQQPPAPKAPGTDSQDSNNQEVPTGQECACTDACTKGIENGPNSADRLAVIADLLADLPEQQRREVIADLPPADRAAVARLLIGKGPSEGRR